MLDSFFVLRKARSQETGLKQLREQGSDCADEASPTTIEDSGTD